MKRDRSHRPEPSAAETPPCALCGRTVSRVSKHHLVPKSEGKPEGGTLIAMLCAPCHRTLHSFFTNRTLATEKCTLEALRQDPDIRRYLAWVRRQPDRVIRVRASTRKR
jgi:hypothetical protein